MSGDADKLAQIEARQEDEPGAGYITLLPEERDALVEIAKAARKAVNGMTELKSLPGVTGTIDDEAIDALRAALSALDGEG